MVHNSSSKWDQIKRGDGVVRFTGRMPQKKKHTLSMLNIHRLKRHSELLTRRINRSKAVDAKTTRRQKKPAAVEYISRGSRQKQKSRANNTAAVWDKWFVCLFAFPAQAITTSFAEDLTNPPRRGNNLLRLLPFLHLRHTSFGDQLRCHRGFAQRASEVLKRYAEQGNVNSSGRYANCKQFAVASAPILRTSQAPWRCLPAASRCPEDWIYALIDLSNLAVPQHTKDAFETPMQHCLSAVSLRSKDGIFGLRCCVVAGARHFVSHSLVRVSLLFDENWQWFICHSAPTIPHDCFIMLRWERVGMVHSFKMALKMIPCSDTVRFRFILYSF